MPSKESYSRRIHTVTLRETIIRFGAVFHFVCSAWAVFTGAHDILAFLFVGIGLDEPEDWPAVELSSLATEDALLTRDSNAW